MLRFYDRIQKRDYDRFEGYIPLICPRHQLLPFQFRREHSANNYIQSVILTNGAELIDSGAWTNQAIPINYDTFTDAVRTITSAIEASDATPAYALTNTLDTTLKENDLILITINLTLNSGVIPDMYVAFSLSSLRSQVVNPLEGSHKYTLKVFGADPERNLLLVKGAVPGYKNKLLLIRKSSERK